MNVIKKLALLLLFVAVCLSAADFWQSKPFTAWSDKEVQKILQNSPWSHVVNATPTTPPLPVTNSHQGHNQGNLGDISGGGVPPASSGMGDNSRGSHSIDEMGGVNAVQNVMVTVRWQSSLAIKQALVRLKYGSEAATSSEARKALESEDANYIVVVSGIPKPLLRGDSDTMKRFLMEQTTLSVKGREPMKPVDVIIHEDHLVDAYLAFRRNPPITLDDKDVEFVTNLAGTGSSVATRSDIGLGANFPGGVTIHQRFHLKDLLLNGKLEL